MPASRAVEETRMPLAPPPQRERRSQSSRSTVANGLPSRTTTPGTPPSRTMRLEPRPSAMTGTAGSSSARKSLQVRRVGRLEQPFRPAARLEPDERRERRVGGQPAAHLGKGRRPRSCAPPSPGLMPSARPAAHLVMSPAPRQMIMSPGAASDSELAGDDRRRRRRSWRRGGRAASALRPEPRCRSPRSAPRRPDRRARPARCRRR